MTQPSSTHFATLIPALAEWTIDVENWTRFTGTFELAVGYSRLFWPDFVEHDGCVLFAGFSKDSYDGFMKSRQGDRVRVQLVMNHRHLHDYFGVAFNTNATQAQILYLGRMLKNMWEAKLARDFPGRPFVVSFPEDPSDDLLDYQITFWKTQG